MAKIKPSNEHLFAKLTQFEQQSYTNISLAANELAEKDPKLDTRVYNRFLTDYLEAGVKHRAMLDDYLTRAKQAGIVPDPQSVNSLSIKYRDQFVKEFNQNTLPQYGESGKQAMQKLGMRLKPKSIPERMMGQFYDGEKGGVQWGGIIGGLVGGLLVFNALGGLGGGPLGFIGAALAAVAGAWLVNMGAEKIGGYIGRMGGKDKQKGQGKDGQNLVMARAPNVANYKAPNLGEILPNEMVNNTVIADARSVDESEAVSPMTTPGKQQKKQAKGPNNPQSAQEIG